jgi:hypothetical protein
VSTPLVDEVERNILLGLNLHASEVKLVQRAIIVNGVGRGKIFAASEIVWSIDAAAVNEKSIWPLAI